MILQPIITLHNACTDLLVMEGLQLYLEFLSVCDLYNKINFTDIKEFYKHTLTRKRDNIIIPDIYGFPLTPNSFILSEYLSALFTIQKSKRKANIVYFDKIKQKLLTHIQIFIDALQQIIYYVSDEINIRRYFNIDPDYSLIVKAPNTYIFYKEQTIDSFMVWYYSSIHEIQPRYEQLVTRSGPKNEIQHIVAEKIWPEDYI